MGWQRSIRASSVDKARCPGQSYTATIVEAEDFPAGRAVEYDDKRYTSLTAAARTTTGHPINGWLFWQIAGQQ